MLPASTIYFSPILLSVFPVWATLRRNTAGCAAAGERLEEDLLVLAGLSVPSLQAQSGYRLNVVRVKPADRGGQDFVCVSPYTVTECEKQVAILQPVLHRYNAEKLGKWTWVLVRSADWKQFVPQLYLNPDSPAFSHLEMRQTFLEEALLVLKPDRQVELLKIWHIPFDRFLDYAITHELGHAFCNEPDEVKAERAGQGLLVKRERDQMDV